MVICFISVHWFQLKSVCTDLDEIEQFVAAGVEDEIEQFDSQQDHEDEIEQFSTQGDNEDEIAQFEDCNSQICAVAQSSAETAWASVAYENQIDAGASCSAVWKLGVPEQINAEALNSAACKLGEPKPINAVALDSADQSVSSHSPEQWPTVSIDYLFS